MKKKLSSHSLKPTNLSRYLRSKWHSYPIKVCLGTWISRIRDQRRERLAPKLHKKEHRRDRKAFSTTFQLSGCTKTTKSLSLLSLAICVTIWANSRSTNSTWLKKFSFKKWLKSFTPQSSCSMLLSWRIYLKRRDNLKTSSWSTFNLSLSWMSCFYTKTVLWTF